MPISSGPGESRVNAAARPSTASTLIAIGHFGRQVLWEQQFLLRGFDGRVLVVRRTPKPMRQFADIVLHYDRHHAEVWPELCRLIHGAESVSLVAAAGGVAGGLLTLRLAQEALWANKRLAVSLSTPFSWEGRRRYWRSIYVFARLRRLGDCKLSVVHTSRIEAMAVPGELLETTLFRLTRQAAFGLVGSREAAVAAPR